MRSSSLRTETRRTWKKKDRCVGGDCYPLQTPRWYRHDVSAIGKEVDRCDGGCRNGLRGIDHQLLHRYSLPIVQGYLIAGARAARLDGSLKYLLGATGSCASSR